MQLTGIWRYPVKSCRGEELTAARVEPWGLTGDRRWMIVDDQGRKFSKRDGAVTLRSLRRSGASREEIRRMIGM